MGQYFRAILKQNKNRRYAVYNRNVNGCYTMAKLMEHSWWDNDFCKAIEKKLYHRSAQVGWIGDYADDDVVLPKARMEVSNIHGIKGIEIQNFDENSFTLDNKFLINKDKKEYVDLNEYKEKSIDKDGWIINPLPLLTAVGNGNGGGDYFAEQGKEFVGTWAFDRLIILDKPYKSYKKLDLCFKE